MTHPYGHYQPIVDHEGRALTFLKLDENGALQCTQVIVTDQGIPVFLKNPDIDIGNVHILNLSDEKVNPVTLEVFQEAISDILSVMQSNSTDYLSFEEISVIHDWQTIDLIEYFDEWEIVNNTREPVEIKFNSSENDTITLKKKGSKLHGTFMITSILYRAKEVGAESNIDVRATR